MKNKKLNNIKLDLFIIFFIALTGYLLFYLISYSVKDEKSKRQVKEFILSTTTKNNVVNVSNQIDNKEQTKKVEKELTLNDYREKYNNKDIVGILSVKNTKINTLLLQAEDNEYYLRRLPNKKKHIMM